jgi:hypothetical protein
MHLTNYSLNKQSPDYKHEPDSAEDILKPNLATKRVLSTVYTQLEQIGINTTKIKQQIEYCCKGIIQIVSNMIAHNLKNSFGGKSTLIKGDVFHVFGFDVLLDEQLKAWILEINEYPSFNIFFETEDEEEENIMS